MAKTTTEQDNSKMINNPDGKGGFADHPENRNPGGWKKEHSISYQYNLIMRMSPKEYKEFKPETVAQEIALARIKAARSSLTGLQDAKEITDRTEGKAPQRIDVTNPDGSLNPYAALSTEELKKLAKKDA